MGSGLMVKDIMVRRLVVASPSQTIKEGAELMKREGVGSVIIVDGAKAKGIVTERDIVRKAVAEGKSYEEPLESIMSHPLIVIHEGASVEEAAKIMRDGRIKRLPVVDDSGSLVGIITEDDILRIFPSIVDLLELKAQLSQ